MLEMKSKPHTCRASNSTTELCFLNLTLTEQGTATQGEARLEAGNLPLGSARQMYTFVLRILEAKSAFELLPVLCLQLIYHLSC
jgi:hypothetical protein